MAQRTPPFATDPQQGVSLIETLMGVALMACVALAVTSVMSQWAKNRVTVELGSDRLAIRQRLLEGIDCTQTLAAYKPAASCPAYISLLDKGGGQIVAGSSGGTKMGRWTVRAACSAAGIRVEVAAVTASKASGFVDDPMTGTPLNWTSLQAPLYPAGAGPCQSAFNTQAPPGVLFGGFIARCPFVATDNLGGYKKVAVDVAPRKLPLNGYTNSTDCPTGYVPRLSLSFPNVYCSLGAYGECAWKINTGQYRGCGHNLFMCLKSTDGSSIPPDGSGYD